MRGAGLVDSPRGLGQNDHVCWLYDDRSEFVEAGIEFLVEGLALGQRALYVGGPDDDMCGELAALEEHRRRGELAMRTFAEMNAEGSIIGQPALYVRETEVALEEGFAGLRVAADPTLAVLDESKRAAHVRYEHAADRLMAGGLPLSAMCAYDRGVLGVAAADELACVHPYAHGATTPFRVFATDTDTIAVVGEIDAICAESFATVIEHALQAHEGDEAGVDCSALDFIDQRTLVMLDAAATSAGVTVRLSRLRDDAARMTDLLALRAVRVA